MFSDKESKVLKALGKKKMSIKDITIKVHGNKPLYGDNNTIGAAIRNIVRKCEDNGTDWTLASEGMGRHGKTVWKKKK